MTRRPIAAQRPVRQGSSHRGAVIAATLGITACAGAATEPAAPPVATIETSAPEPPSGDLEEPSEASSPPEETPTSWRAPLPPLALAPLDDAQRERVRQCLDPVVAGGPGVAPLELVVAAECVAAVPAPGAEIRIYEQIVTHHPTAPEVQIALARAGQRFEQIDQRFEAMKRYAAYLERFRAAPDARELGQRAVCLALSLELQTEVDAILARLERAFGRRGFERPSPEQLAARCHGDE